MSMTNIRCFGRGASLRGSLASGASSRVQGCVRVRKGAGPGTDGRKEKMEGKCLTEAEVRGVNREMGDLARMEGKLKLRTQC